LIERIKKHFTDLPPHQEAMNGKVIQDSIGRSIAYADFPGNFPLVIFLIRKLRQKAQDLLLISRDKEILLNRWIAHIIEYILNIMSMSMGFC
jgi:hypothetical protein